MSEFYHLILKPHSSKKPLFHIFLNAFIFKPFLIFCLTFSFFLSGCTEEQPVNIGFIGGLTGRVADLGISGRNGALLAIEQRNKLGGINGRPIHLTTVDDKQDKIIAEKAFNSLVDQGMEAIIGHMTSSMSVATVPLANKKHKVLMSPTSTTTFLSDIDDYFLRVCATTDTYGQEMARYLRNAKKLSKVIVVYDMRNKAYTKSWIKHFSGEFIRLGGEVIRHVTYTSGPDVHFDDIAQQVLQKDAEGIIISSSAVDAGMLCQQIRKLNDTVVIATSEWAATEKLLELGGIAVEEIIVSQFFDRYSTDPNYLKFKKEFIQRFGQKPGFASVGAYDATNVILEAIARKEKKQDLKQVILTIGSFDGVQGKIQINRYGDSDRKTYLSIVRNGKFVSP